MAAIALKGADVRPKDPTSGSVGNRAPKGRHAQIAVLGPDVQVDLCRLDPVHQPKAQRIIDRRQVDKRRLVPDPRRKSLMQAGRISLDHFAQRVEDGLIAGVACAEPVGTGQKHSVTRGVQTQVASDNVARHPDGPPGNQVKAAHPVERSLHKVALVSRQQRKSAGIHRMYSPQPCVACFLDIPETAFGVEKLNRFHRSGNARVGQRHTFALGYRKRACIRTDCIADRNADAIQAGHISDPRNTHIRKDRGDPRPGLGGIGCPVRSGKETLFRSTGRTGYIHEGTLAHYPRIGKSQSVSGGLAANGTPMKTQLKPGGT